MIEVFKILRGIDVVNAGETFLKLGTGPLKDRTCGHSLKLIKPRHRAFKRNMYFSSQVVDHWNSLPEEVVTSTSINDFKNRYNQYVAKQ